MGRFVKTSITECLPLRTEKKRGACVYPARRHVHRVARVLGTYTDAGFELIAVLVEAVTDRGE